MLVGLNNGRFDVAFGYLSDAYAGDMEIVGIHTSNAFETTPICLFVADGGTIAIDGELD